MKRYYAAVLVCALSFQALPTSYASDWPTFQQNERHTGVSPDASIKTPMKLAWSFQTNGPIRSQPVVKDGIVYVGSDDEVFYALDIKTGKLIWRAFSDWAIRNPATVDSAGTVYYGAGDQLVALDARTGKTIWISKTCKKPPPGLPGDHFMHSDELYVAPFPDNSPNAIDGHPFPTQSIINTPLLAAKGMVFLGTGTTGGWGYMQAFDARTGNLCWKRQVSEYKTQRTFGGMVTGAVMHRDILFWPDILIEALDPYSGKRIPGWNEPTWTGAGHSYSANAREVELEIGVAITDDGIAVMHVQPFFHHSNGFMIDLSSNLVRQTRGMQSGQIVQRGSAPVVYRNLVVYATRKQVVCHRMPKASWASSFVGAYRETFRPTVCMANKILFAVTEKGTLFALKLSEAGKLEKVWEHKLGSAVMASGAIADGTYLIGAENGKLYAFKGSN